LAAGRPTVRSEVDALCRAAFASAPDAHAWAERYARDVVVSERTYRRQTAPHTVAYAVEGIAVACVDDVADRLVSLLEQTVAAVATRVERVGAPAPAARERSLTR
jgi:hypothetical protein